MRSDALQGPVQAAQPKVPPARLLAPDLVPVELLNAGWKAWRTGAITILKDLALQLGSSVEQGSAA